MAITADDVELFEASRQRLEAIAYRLLGSAAEAEDAVQEAFLRWQAADRGRIEVPQAWLTKVLTNQCLNQLGSARARRETYVGQWLPEPLLAGDPMLGPADTAEQRESVSLAVLHLMERLSPVERGVYVLREAFDYPYDRIAEILESTVVAARQLVSRARKHVESGRTASVGVPAQRRLLEAFLTAARRGDTVTLEQLFAAEVVSRTDGNGVKLAARIPVVGRARVAKFIAAFASHFWIGKTIDWVVVNGQPAAAVREDGVVTTLVTLTASDAGIDQLMWVMSPDKLRHVAPAS